MRRYQGRCHNSPTKWTIFAHLELATQGLKYHRNNSIHRHHGRTDQYRYIQVWSVASSEPAYVYTLCLRKKRHLFIVITCQFANSRQKHTPGNLEQTQMHRQPHLVSFVRTIPCKISQRFLRHIVSLQCQIRSVHKKVKLSHQITIE